MTPRIAEIDPITLEILWSRLISILDEADTTLLRTSYSAIVGEAHDYAVALLDAEGNSLAEANATMPAFVGMLSRTARSFLQVYPPSNLEPGDVIISNDPWICAGHLPDITLITPIYHRGRMVALAGCAAHLSDVGGRGTSEGRDIFEEGLRIPPLKLYVAGQPNHDLFAIIQNNSRSPEDVVGDIRAQMLANAVTARRLSELLDEYGLEDVADLSAAIQSQTEAAMRRQIDRLPAGVYRASLDLDGFEDHPLRVEVAITIGGGEITVDYTGTSPQVDYAINCPINLTYSETVFPFRASLLPNLPSAEGSMRPIKVIAPPGTIVSPAFPAPVRSRVVVVHNLHAAIYRALQPLVPDYLRPPAIQAHSGCIWGVWWWGPRPTPGTKGPTDVPENWVAMYIFNGGKGATGAADGQHCLSFPQNCSNIPVEYLESRTPMLFECKELITDSGGAGRYRGGTGQRVRIRSLSDKPYSFVPISTDRIRFAPIGLLGGRPGRAGRLALNDTQELSSRTMTMIQPGDTITMETPGGGGVYDPHQRDPEAVRQDVRMGLVSAQAAVEVYGADADRVDNSGAPELTQVPSGAMP
ncbi:MAG TPA: hydantoinase B/oxoprolinase family protein [bacterium]|nr:hydantoinase B/oxoprolinase family protein [bacterium]